MTTPPSHIKIYRRCLFSALCTALLFFCGGTAHAIDDNIHQKHRKMAIYQALDKMDREQGADETQIFVLNKISELLDPAANAGKGDDLRAIFTWLQDWHDMNRHPLYGLVLSEHFLTMLQSDLAIHDLQHEELVKKMLQNYFLAFVIIREEMARCAHPSQESAAGNSFVAFLLRYKLYKTLYNTLDDTQKRLIYKYVEKNEQKLHNRPRTDKYCLKPGEDAAEFLPQDEWEKKRADLFQELKEAMGQ
ncbi:MAG: hypothetical protein D8M28_05785 [Proteobacteria bacterium]|nr:hypothetical protein [Pseudomonadota bacterium]